MVSNIDTAKRALVTLLKSLAVIYGLAYGLTRESADVQVWQGNDLRPSAPFKSGAYQHKVAPGSPWALASTRAHLVTFVS